MPPSGIEARSSHPLLTIVVLAGLASAGAAGGATCATTATTLCMQTSFEVAASFADGHGTMAGEVAVIPGVDSNVYGAFTFRDPRHGELLVKMLDACVVNGFYWVFATSLTDLPFTLTVRDTDSANEKDYVNPAGSRSRFFDTAAFPCSAGTASAPRDAMRGEELAAWDAIAPGSEKGFFCVVDSDTACLYDDRFWVEIAYDYTASGGGAGMAFALAPNFVERSALFGSFDDTTVDAGVKIVETCGGFAVHWANFTDAALDIEVSDLDTGLTWHSPGDSANGVDPSAFTNGSGCLFGTGFETGDVFEWSGSAP